MRKIALFVLILLGVSACGVRGDLERPGPLWGPDNRTPAERAYETEDSQDADNEAQTDDGAAS